MSIQKITSWLLYLLMAASAISAVVFYAVGFDDKNPENADQLLYWSYVLVFLGLGSTLILSLVNFIKNLINEPKKAIRSLAGIVVLVVVILVSYAMSNGTPLNIVGYSGPDNVPDMLKFADTMLYSMYILAVLAILMVIASSVFRLFK